MMGSNQLMSASHASFGSMGRPRNRNRIKWKEFGSLEQEINSKLDYEINTPIHRDSLRCGAIGYKMGMTSIYDKWGVQIPCTVIQIDRCQVTQVRKYINGLKSHSIEVGAGEANIETVKKPQLGHYLKANLPVKKHVASFKVTKDNFLPVGYAIGPSHFKIGNYVDFQGTSKGKGFQGTIKRWNFKHQSFTHGNSKAHRKPGALQGCEFPGRVFRGKKMAGKMGNKPTTHYASKVMRIDNERSLLYVRGPVPGANGGMLKIRDSNKRKDKQTFEVNPIKTGIDTYEGDELDPFEQNEHENAGVAGPDADED
jgi:large subunit ribosomal protein L3